MKMKSLLSLTALICCFSFASLGAKEIKKDVATSSQENTFPSTQTLSKAFGHLIAKNLTDSTGYQFDIQEVISGIQEELNGTPSPLTEEQYEVAIAQIQKQCFEEMSDQNLSQANQFLEENAKNEGIKEIVPGKLQVSVLKEGNGPQITENSTPLIHYTGRYVDETLIGTSEQMDPIALDLTEAIEGFRQGLLGAKEGESRRLFIHPDLGYGESGFLLPNALLIFDIEVLKTHTENAIEDVSELTSPHENHSL